MAWTADAYDFHALSIQTVKLAAYYKTDNTNITTAITLTLLLRSVGAAIFGLAGDRFGRKYPMVANMLICKSCHYIFKTWRPESNVTNSGLAPNRHHLLLNFSAVLGSTFPIWPIHGRCLR